MHELPGPSAPSRAASLLGLTAATCAVLVVLAATGRPASTGPYAGRARREHQVRHELFQELRPVTLENCELERFGEPHDGGYLMCGNLLGEARAAYSYGISGYDGWGCDMAARLSATTHQYDCFDRRQPSCDSGRTMFHPTCVAAEPRVDEEGRVFGPLHQQIAENGDAAHRIVVKMDVEGAEWDSLLHTPDQVLHQIDQLAIELHGIDEPRFLEVVRKLKRTFEIAHVHANNYTCNVMAAPFPGRVYEVLFVNKRLARVAPGAPLPPLPHPLDRPNVPSMPVCIPVWR